MSVQGYAYSKIEVLLLDLRQRSEFTDDLFAEIQPAAAEKIEEGMKETRFIGVVDEDKMVTKFCGKDIVFTRLSSADPVKKLRTD